MSPGQSAVLEYTFSQTGRYEIWCPLEPGHRDLGMTGILVAVDARSPRAQSVAVTMYEWGLAPLDLTAIAGQPVRFAISNLGQYSHALSIAGHGISVRSPAVQVGQATTLEVTFDSPGVYRVWCPFTSGGNHWDMGMVGILLVLPSGE